MKKFTHIDTPKFAKLERRENNGIREYQLPSGVWVPSVTTVVGSINKKGIERWRSRVGEEEANRVLSVASARGTDVHNVIEKYLDNTENFLTEEFPTTKSTFRDFKFHLDKIDNIRYLETGLHSERMRLAGTADCIADFDGTLSVIDFKTSRKPKKEKYIESYFLQATAYALMHEDLTGIPVDQIVILIWSQEGEVQEFVKSKRDYMDKLFDVIVNFHQLRKAV